MNFLLPRIDTSDGIYAYFFVSSKVGSVQWLLVEGAKRAKLKDPGLKLFFDRIAFKKGKSKATVAVARRLSEIIWHVVTNDEDYNPKKVLRHRRVIPSS